MGQQQLRSMTARHESICEVCTWPIDEGDEIALLPDDGIYVHIECAADEGFEVED